MAAIVVVAIFACTPEACGALYDPERRYSDVADLIIGAVPPIASAGFPPVIAALSLWKRVGWRWGIGFTVLSLVLSYVSMGVWVDVWS